MEILDNNLFENLDNEMIDIFKDDEPLFSLEEKIKEAQKITEEYLQAVTTQYPNRYFILKKISQNADFWEIALQKKMILINDENFAKKLQNCFEVSDNVYLIFMRLEEREFLGYCRVISNYYSLKEIPELYDTLIYNGSLNEELFIFKIQWKSKSSIPFENVRFIRNSLNSNNSINMCKEFNEVDEFAAKILINIFDNSKEALSPNTNPFHPISSILDGKGIAQYKNLHQLKMKNFIDCVYTNPNISNNKTQILEEKLKNEANKKIKRERSLSPYK